ncbi:MAG: hypothetical protein N3F11_04235 [Casimicrobiaceae bacterium]|nr:hypothetical protein [Casimicrobiaceae bacterium]
MSSTPAGGAFVRADRTPQSMSRLLRGCLPRLLVRAAAGSLTLAVAILASGELAARPAACPVGASIAERDLPQEARAVLAAIRAGGPFEFERDGIVFHNRERILPKAERGYYREYTVRTPGVRTRGARRIVCGGEQRAAQPCYYSEDHYASFRCIVP